MTVSPSAYVLFPMDHKDLSTPTPMGRLQGTQKVVDVTVSRITEEFRWTIPLLSVRYFLAYGKRKTGRPGTVVTSETCTP